MTMLLGAMLAAVLAQVQPDRTTSGQVLDDRGKPAEGVRVVLFAPPLTWGKENTAEAGTTTDAEGRFRMKIPPLGRRIVNGVNLLQYRPGLAISAVPWFRYRGQGAPLRKPDPRKLRVEGPDGRPIAGARVAPRVLYVAGNAADIPDSLAGPMAVTTGSDGTATLDYLTARDQLVAARVTADPIGTQDILLVERPGQSSTEPVIAIRLGRTSRLTGRVVDAAGKPIAGQVIEVWSRGGGDRVRPGPVGLAGGPLRTEADGSFRTPENLLVGTSYRVAVRAPGKETILTDWMTIGDQPRALLPMRQRSLRTVAGQVVDRRGKPVAGIEVFQAGAGPEPTSTRTGPDGRFTLGGLKPGLAFLFARGDGFRFHGQMVREGEEPVTVELARRDEPPARAMRMLPGPISQEESRAMALRLAEPVWRAVAEKGDESTRFRTLEALAEADPAGTLEKLESSRFAERSLEFRIRTQIAAAMAAVDPEEAAAVAEAIPDPGPRAGALIRVVDALPAGHRDRAAALLERAAVHARATPDALERLRWLGDAAERLHELGEVARARALFVEGLQLANQLPDRSENVLGTFAGQLAMVDEPAARAIAGEFKGRPGALVPLAIRLMDRDPAEAERLWEGALTGGLRAGTRETMFWRMAMVDPARSRRFLEARPFRSDRDSPVNVYIAMGGWKKEPAEARRALDEGLRGLDRLLLDDPEWLREAAVELLPVVERVDPGLVPEFFWRAVASLPTSGNPRTIASDAPTYLIERLAWYDRAVAAVLFEPARWWIEHADPRELATWRAEFRAWAAFDPRTAVERLENVPVRTDSARDANAARVAVAGSLGMTHEARWRDLWQYQGRILGTYRNAY